MCQRLQLAQSRRFLNNRRRHARARDYAEELAWIEHAAFVMDFAAAMAGRQQ
jgi:hypothetical protein